MFIPRKEVIKSGTVWDLDVINQITYQGVPFIPGGNATDEKIKITAADTTAGYLGAKVAAGTGIQLTTTNPGANETLTIACTVVDLDVKVKVSANDTTAGFLNGKLVAGTGITFTENNDGGNETLTVTLGSHTHAASDITSGVLGTARLASTGTASASTYLRGDQAWSGIDAGHITAGTVATARLGTGTASSSTYLKGDQTYSGLDAGHITAGTVPTARLATGTANSTTFLRGDQTWATAGVTGFTSSQNTSSPNNVTNASRLLVDATSTNADAVIQPKGTGALLAQLPDSTTTGGSKRGERAVDFQTYRTLANQVAAGNYSGTLSGYQNRASGAAAVITGGSGNNASANWSIIGGGSDNQATGVWSTIVGGANNSASGQYSAALSGWYTAAFTDYATVGGGLGNTVYQYCNYSFIGGGNYNFIGTGSTNCSYSVLGGGDSNQVLASYAAILGGKQNYVGYNNSGANSMGGVIIGGESAFTNRKYQRAFAAGNFGAVGDAQTEWYDVRRVVTTSSWTALTVDGSTPDNFSNTIRIMPSSAYTFQALISAIDSGATSTAAGYKIEGIITNHSGTVALLGTPVVTTFGETLSGMDVRAVADTTNGALSIEFAGSSGYAMRVHAHVTLVKSSFA